MIVSRRSGVSFMAALCLAGLLLPSLAAPAVALGEDIIPEEKKLRPDPLLMAEMKIIRGLTIDVYSLVTHRRLSPAAGRTFQAKKSKRRSTGSKRGQLSLVNRGSR